MAPETTVQNTFTESPDLDVHGGLVKKNKYSLV